MPQKFEWTDEMLALLGTVPDQVIAKQLGIQQTTVRRRRVRLGRDSWRVSAAAAIWTPGALVQLGKMTDARLASQLGIDVATVRQKRRSLGILRGAPRGHWMWTEEQVSLLGTASDREVAMQVGCSVAQAWHARNKREIPLFRPAPLVDGVIQQLGVVPDAQLAQAVGISVSRVEAERRRRGIPPAKAPRWFDGLVTGLGTQPDSRIAQQYSVSISTVAKLRKARDIPSDTKRRAWRPEELEMLGKFSDAEVARRTGRTRSAVKLERMNRRILGIDPREAVRLHLQTLQLS